MYPEGRLLAPDGRNFLSFEKDPLNPSNEGFIEFWSVLSDNSTTFRYRKRLGIAKAFSLWKSLIKEEWKVFDELELAA